MQKSQQENTQTLIDKLNDQLICPISHQIMKDPVSIESGHTFDRVSIEMWFNRNRGRPINPLTGEKLNSIKLYPNICARNIINKLPDLKKRMQKEQKNYEELLQTVIALENLWNSQTPKGVSEILKQKQKLEAQKEQLKIIKINQKLEYERKLLEKQAQILRLQHHLRYQTNNCNNLKRQLSLTKRQMEQKRQKQSKSQMNQLQQKQAPKPLDETQIVNLNHMRIKQKFQREKSQEKEQQHQINLIDRKKNISQVLNRPPKYPNAQKDPSPSKSQENRDILKKKLQKQQVLKLPPKINVNPEEKQERAKSKQKNHKPPAEQMRQRKQQRSKKIISSLQNVVKKSKEKLKKR